MKFRVFIVFVFFACYLLPVISLAQNKVVVIPLMDDVKCKCRCTGTLSPGGRWCDQGDGTVIDMSTDLVWLKSAGEGGTKPWRALMSYDDAHRRASEFRNGMGGLSDGSSRGDWRLPTHSEMRGLGQGIEPFCYGGGTPFSWFALGAYYWTSSTSQWDQGYAFVGMRNDSNYVCLTMFYQTKSEEHRVWPVRACVLH